MENLVKWDLQKDLIKFILINTTTQEQNSSNEEHLNNSPFIHQLNPAHAVDTKSPRHVPFCHCETGHFARMRAYLSSWLCIHHHMNDSQS